MNYLYFTIGFMFALAIGPGLKDLDPGLIDVNGTIKSALIAIFVIILTIFLWPVWCIIAIILILLSDD
jgi:hypothetical protein